jgi:hypothetical protein
MPQLLYPEGKSPLYPLDRRLGGPQSWSGHSGEEKNSQPLPGFIFNHLPLSFFHITQNNLGNSCHSHDVQSPPLICEYIFYYLPRFYKQHFLISVPKLKGRAAKLIIKQNVVIHSFPLKFREEVCHKSLSFYM